MLTIQDISSDIPYSTQIGPFGKALTPEDYKDSGTPLLRGVNVNKGRFFDEGFVFVSDEMADSLTKYICKPGEIILVHKGTIGEIGIIPEKTNFTRYLMGNSMLRIVVNEEKMHPQFLYYWMCSTDAQWYLKSRLSTVGVPQLHRPLDTLRKLPIPKLSLQQQERIFQPLSSLDSLIETNENIMKHLNEISNSLFRSWFIDFDPMKAKAEGKLPYGMNEETAALFPNTFEDSELGPIPAGWKWGQLGDCISVVGGGTPSTKNEAFWDGEYNWTSPKDLSNSNSIIMLDTERTITEAGLAKVSSGLLPVDTVLMSSRAPIGYLALSKIPVAINQGYIAIPPKNNMSPNFMLSWIHFNMPLIEAYSSGSTFPEISKKEFRKLPILIPPAELIEKFNEKTTRLYDSMETSLKQMNSLISTRDAILPRLMSGELSVS